MGTYGADKNSTTILNSRERRLQKVYYKDWKIDYFLVILDKSNAWKGLSMEQLKPYLHIEVEQVSEYNADPAQNKLTTIRMRECTESDFSKPYNLEQYRTLGYF